MLPPISNQSSMWVWRRHGSARTLRVESIPCRRRRLDRLESLAKYCPWDPDGHGGVQDAARLLAIDTCTMDALSHSTLVWASRWLRSLGCSVPVGWRRHGLRCGGVTWHLPARRGRCRATLAIPTRFVIRPCQEQVVIRAAASIDRARFPRARPVDGPFLFGQLAALRIL